MLTFQKVNRDDMSELVPYFRVQRTHISDYSLGFQFMWNRAHAPEYAFAGGCLILRGFYSGKYYFHYPLSLSGDDGAEALALDEIERYCRDSGQRLHYTNVPREKLPAMLDRYGVDCAVNNRRRWRDYLYRAEDFRSFSGKRYAGQRNHVNRFKQKYDWSFRPYVEADEPLLTAFLERYARERVALEEETRSHDFAYELFSEELEETRAIVPRLASLGMKAGLLFADGELVGFSAGEVCGDMLIVHIEKALRGYEGAYPFLAQQFACTFAQNSVFLNRMDDAGDWGLRKSKLQYLPVELVGKFNVLPRRAIETVAHPPELFTPRLVLKEVPDGDAAAYARLARDRERNRYWGYDWRSDFPNGEPDDGWFLSLAREDFHRKEELSLGIYLADALAGEAVLHRFGYRSEAEIGFRLLPEYEHNGYAREAVTALAGYAFFKLGLENLEAKCYRENERSERTLRGAGFRFTGEDATFRYFLLTPSAL